MDEVSLEGARLRTFDPKERLRKALLRDVLRMTQLQLANEWGASQPFVAMLLAASGVRHETRSLDREIDFVERVNRVGGDAVRQFGGPFTHADLWPPHRNYPSNRTNSVKVAQRADSLRATISELRAAGASSWRDLADGLNSRGISTPRGGRWFPASVGRLLRAMQNSEPARDNAA